MGKVVIVAIPADEEPVWEISSEKIPHLTLLFFGENDDQVDIKTITEFVEHASKGLDPFWLSVDHRGTLGDDNADVLFFRKDVVAAKSITDFRGQLLQNDAIQRAYLSTEQFPEWLPHLTLGYPETPAKKPKNAWDRDLYYVHFNRIALWTGESEGPEFRLGTNRLEEEDQLMYDDLDLRARGLAHYGVKGMKWGVRTKDRSATDVTVTQVPGKKVKAAGGQNQTAHPDAVKAATAKQKAKKSSTDALSDQELRGLINRMQMEQQFSQLNSNQKSRGRKFVENELEQMGRTEVKRLGQKVIRKAVIGV